MLKRALFSCLILCAVICSQPASASIHGSTASAPILQDVTVSFGNATPSGRGTVRLSSVDFAMPSVTPLTFTGVDLVVGGTPVTNWVSVTCVSATVRTCADFSTIAANTAEGSGAVTPWASSGGAGNLAGDYVFAVVGQDALGHNSNTGHITYHTVNPGGGACGAANIGTEDRTDFGVTFSGFGTSAGCYILTSTGLNQIQDNSRWLIKFNGGFTNTVIMQPADAGKYPALDNIDIANMSNMTVQHFKLSGYLDQAAQVQGILRSEATTGNSISNVIFNDDFYYGSEAMLPLSSNLSGLPFYSTNGCTSGCEMHASGGDYMIAGFVPGSNTEVDESWVRHVYNNLAFIANGNSVTWFHDYLLSPNTNSSEHIDSYQIADGASPEGTVTRRMVIDTSDGDALMQGFWFEGSNIDAMVYITAGSGSSAPGSVMTLVSGNMETAFAGTHIVAVGGSPAFSDNIHITGGGGSSFTTDAPGTVAYGSPGSPIHIYSAQGVNQTVDGVLEGEGDFNAFGLNGFQGTSSIKHMSVAQHQPIPFYETAFTGSTDATGTVLTVAGPITNNIPGVVAPWIGNDFNASGGRIKYSGCNYCGPGINYQITGNRGTITASFVGTTMHVTALSGGMFLAIGDILSGAGITVPTGTGTYTEIVSQIATAGGDIATYTVSRNNGTIGSETITAGAVNGPGTYLTGGATANLSSVPMTTTGSYPITGAAFGSQFNCAIPILNNGTLVEDGIYMQGGLNPCASLPSGQTTAHLYSNSNTSPSDFASGQYPQAYLEAIPNATWKAKTPAQIELSLCLAHKPSSTSVIVNPTITPATAVNGSGGGDWNDGLPSPHIAGCEAIP